MTNEATVQAAVRLEAARRGWRLYRNNVGALIDSRGVPVRYGLANESKALNERVKSSDLIGWRPVVIGPEHLGLIFAQFVSVEAKREGWAYRGDPHELAQRAWLDLVTADGGYARFVTCAAEL